MKGFYSQYQVLSTGILGTVSGATAEEQIVFPLFVRLLL